MASPAQLDRGRQLLLNHMFKVAWLSLVITVYAVVNRGPSTLPPHLIRLSLLGLLFLWLYKGSSIARWISVVLLSLAALVFLVFMPLDNLWAIIFGGVIVYVYLTMVHSLIYSSEVKLFLASQRGEMLVPGEKVE